MNYEAIYRCVAYVAGGMQLKFIGTLMECAKWADMICEEYGPVEIDIKRSE